MTVGRRFLRYELTQFAGAQFTVDETGRNLVISKIIGGFP